MCARQVELWCWAACRLIVDSRAVASDVPLGVGAEMLLQANCRVGQTLHDSVVNGCEEMASVKHVFTVWMQNC